MRDSKSKKKLFNDFIDVMAKEITIEVKTEVRKNGFVAQIKGLEIILKKECGDHQFKEVDFVDALVRLRLLFIEKHNRRLPETKRVRYYSDISIYNTKKHFITDEKTNIVILYNEKRSNRNETLKK